MNYYEMLNRVAFSNAMMKMAQQDAGQTPEAEQNREADAAAQAKKREEAAKKGGTTSQAASGSQPANKPAETKATGTTTTNTTKGNAGGNAGGNNAAGGNGGNGGGDGGGDDSKSLWDQGIAWAKENPNLSTAIAGVGAALPTTALAYYGLDQIPYMRQRRFLNWLLSGAAGTAVGGLAGYYANKSLTEDADSTANS